MNVLFTRGGNFREEDKSAKNAKITPGENFHVNSIGCNEVMYHTAKAHNHLVLKRYLYQRKSRFSN